ncbi:hypothetical protein PENANT_c002G02870 [Penicillium antarcticum]|uniref:Leucine-rich repeat domain-containing protein n=1 Tax=Penicillium antarcticum TaxID=416450 RepID=A0A1V6QK62_9EURO|nr:uncharacterized protein N7508_008543 [Penicillium antarcticum]KAJ5293722.1 hypothetical protein N7508_008543 [Penicillium antarcticum]OQD89628.1 hypothetical protein PENANT_c002G02870 [Penicillium antarcticum]
MYTLGQLPPEIICLIGEQLNSQSDRLHLIFSSRHMYNMLLPTLYSQVRLCDGHHDIETLAPFLNTILRSPALAKEVQHLNVQDWGYSPWEKDLQARFDYNEYDSNLIENADCGIPYSAEEREFQLQGLRKGDSDAWLALLIPHLNNLQSLDIAWPYEENKVNLMFSKAAEDKGCLFPHLQEVYGAHCDTEGGVDSYYMNPFFNFPAMRKVSGNMIVEFEKEEIPGTPVKRCSGIEEIDLALSNNEYGFRFWIQSCIALRSFRLDVGGPIVSSISIQSGYLQESLSYHKTTLERFWLRTDEESDRDEDGGWIGSFAEFSALKMLHVPFAMLIDNLEAETHWELEALLPPSLESLYLCQCDSDLVILAIDQIETLLGLRCLPKLTSLGLECYMPKESIRHRLSLLSKTCEEAGVTFVNLPPAQLETWDYLETVWPRHA